MSDNEMRESPRGRSQLNLFKQCQKRWAFKYLKGFTPVGSQDPLILGSAIHEAQALFYQGESIILVLQFLQEFLRTSPHLQRKALTMLTAWHQELGIYDREHCTPLAVEVQAPLVLPNGYTMTVRWDRVLLDNTSGEIFIADTKTTGGSLEKTLRNYNYSDQPKLYIASVLQNNPEWIKQFRGWRTDVIYGYESKAKKTLGDIFTDVRRSEIVMFTPEEIEDTLIGYASLTDDIAYKLNQVKEGGEIRANFFNSADFCLSFGRVCPYHAICHQIDDIDEPPANMTLDPWLAEGTVLEAFDFEGEEQ